MNSLSGVRSNSPQQILEGFANNQNSLSPRSDRLKGVLSKRRTPRKGNTSEIGDRRLLAIQRLTDQLGQSFPQRTKEKPDAYHREITPKGYSKGQIRQYTPEQFQLLERLLSQTQPDSYLSRLAGGDESLYQEMEAPALRQFGALQGNIASRFSGRGIGGTRGSGFQNTINNASSTFAQDLAARRQGLQQQAIKDLQGIGRELLQERPYDRFLVPPEPRKPSTKDQLLGFLGSFAQGAGRGLGMGLAG